MPWGRTKDDEKVEFELPDDIKAKLELGDKNAAELEALKAKSAESDAALASLKEELQRVRAEMQVAAKPKDKEEPVDEDGEFFSSPAAAIDKRIGKNLLPMATALAEMRADKVMDDLRNIYPELRYPAVAQSLEETVAAYPVGQRASKEFMLNAFRVVRDRLRESGKLDDKEFSSFMERNRQSGGRMDDDRRSAPRTQFDENALRFLNRYGITPEEAEKKLAQLGAGGRFA